MSRSNALALFCRSIFRTAPICALLSSAWAASGYPPPACGCVPCTVSGGGGEVPAVGGTGLLLLTIGLCLASALVLRRQHGLVRADI